MVAAKREALDEVVGLVAGQEEAAEEWKVSPRVQGDVQVVLCWPGLPVQYMPEGSSYKFSGISVTGVVKLSISQLMPMCVKLFITKRYSQYNLI